MATKTHKQQADQLTSIESEAAVLGSIMLDRSMLPVAENILPDELYFSLPEHRILYQLFLELNKKKDAGWDIVVFRDELNKRQQLEAVGGVDYLVKLVESVPHAESCAYYAGIVLDKYKRRQLVDYANSIKTTVQGQEDIEEILQVTEKDLQVIIEDSHKSESMTLLESALDDLSFWDAAQYIPTGFESIDKIIHGFGEGHIIVVAGRPSMGKTSFMLNMAGCISEKYPVALFSLEMTAKDLMQRLVCSYAGVSLTAAIQSRWLTEDQNRRIEDSKKLLKGHKLVIDETRPLTPGRLRSRAFLLQRIHGVRAIFVDYLQLMQPDRKIQSLYETITEISKEIKAIALQMEIPIIVGCQLNREVEKRKIKKPRLSDLRDSGSIEQDADVVLLLNRPGYYKPKATGEEKRKAEIIIAKNRRGHVGTIDMKFIPEFCFFNEKNQEKELF